MGLALSIVSILLSWVLFPISLVYTFIRLMIKAKILQYLQHINKLFLGIAISIDQLGNVVCQHLFNDILIKKDGYRFGNTDDTISYVLGCNKHFKHLTKLGLWLCDMLNFFDKNHVEKTYEGSNGKIN